VLQFGHDLSAVETVPKTVALANFLCRFNSATTFQPWKPQPPDSMSPLLIGFNSATTFQPWKPVAIAASPNGKGALLQFGHDLSAVETGHSTLDATQIYAELQFGHDLSAVETRYHSSCCCA